MRCPFCKSNDDQVVDSREGEGGGVIRRRRKCKACGKRFTTYEKIEDAIRLHVVKRDGRREPYERTKILDSLTRACTKLEVAGRDLERLVDAVEEEVFAGFDREVPSSFIGERTAARLRSLNQVAYVRFASVYRKFTDVTDFIQEAEKVLQSGMDVPGQQMLFDVISRLKRPEPGDAPAEPPSTQAAGAAARKGG